MTNELCDPVWGRRGVPREKLRQLNEDSGELRDFHEMQLEKFSTREEQDQRSWRKKNAKCHAEIRMEAPAASAHYVHSMGQVIEAKQTVHL